MARALGTYARFFWEGIVNVVQTGAVVPSQRFLIARMLSPIPEDFSGLIVELGAGNGALTVQLAARCPKARLIACEINPALARHARARLVEAGLDHRVEVVDGPAEELLSRLDLGPVDFIISGIPLGNLDKTQTTALIDKIAACLGRTGMYIQFQHSLVDRKKIRARFARMQTVPVILNLPPAFVYYAQRPVAAY